MAKKKAPLEERRNYNYRRNKKHPFWRFFNLFFRVALHKPKEIINLNDEPIESKSLIVAPHHAKWGPVYFDVFFPCPTAKMGHHAMLGNYRSRYRYLSRVMYIQKCHRSKFRAYVPTIVEALFSINSYRSMNFIPSYQDMRFMNTMKLASRLIDNDMPLLIFPEDSENGYLERAEKYHGGFAVLAGYYNKTHENELPIYPVYYHIKKRKIVIGKKIYLSELKGKNTDEIAEYFKDRVNELYDNYFK